MKLYSFEYPDVAVIAASFNIPTDPLSSDRGQYWKRIINGDCVTPYIISRSWWQEFNFPDKLKIALKYFGCVFTTTIVSLNILEGVLFNYRLR